MCTRDPASSRRRVSGRAPVALVLAALVGLGLVIGLFAFQRTHSSEARSDGAASAGPAASVVVQPVGSGAAGEAAGETGAASVGARTELVASPIVPAAPDGAFCAVRVVGGVPARPVVGATVRLLALRPKESRAGRQTLPVARHRQLEPLQSLTSDTDGLVRFPKDPKAIAVDAEADGHWGQLELADHVRSETPLVLRIEPYRSVSVLVLDRLSGQPLPGVEVQLNYYYDVATLAERCDSGLSDAEGRVHLEHLGQHMTWFWPHTEFLAVEPAAGWDEAARVKLEFRKLHNEVELRAGAFTGLHVRVLDKEGEPFLGDGTVTVSLLVPSEKGTEVDVSPGSSLHAELRDGSALFPQLTPNARVMVAVSPASAPRMELGDVVLSGPGEQREVTLRLAADAAQWRVRLATSDGVDLSGGWVRLKSGPGLLVPKDGSPLAINPYTAGFEEGHRGSIHIECWLGVRGWHGRLETPADIQPAGSASAVAHADLETLVLEPLPVSVEGAAVDPKGAGVAGVHITQEWSNSKGHRADTRSATTDAAGRFLFSRSLFPEPRSDEVLRMALRLRHGAFETQFLSVVAPGSQGLRIQLVPAGRIEGTVLMEDIWMRDFMEVRAQCKTTSRVSHGSIDVRGELSVGGLPTGSYTVTLTMNSELASLQRVERVSVVAGKVTRDPRLQNLDLRGRTGWLQVAVRDRDGKLVPDAWARARVDPADEWGPEEYADDWGQVHIFSRAAPAELFVGAEGYTSRLVATPRDGDQVVLDAARTIALHWENFSTDLPKGVRVRVECISMGPGRPPGTLYPSMSLDPDYPEPTPWDGGTELQVTLVLTLEDGANQRQDLAPLRFQVPLDAATTAFGVPFPLSEARTFAERVAPR